MRTLLVRVLPFVGVIGLAVACTAKDEIGSDSDSIINGTADTTHNAVIALFSTSGLCSGTIVKKDVEHKIGWVVTAAHCVTHTPTVAIQTTDFSIRDGSLRYSVIDWKANEGYGHGQGHDFAVVRIAGVDESTPVIPLVGESDGLETGAAVTSVGFGRTDPGAPTPENHNSKRNAIAKQVAGLSDVFIAYDMSENGICQGDSGGPVLVGAAGKERVAGIHSFIQGGCTGRGFSGRITQDSAFFETELTKELPAASCNLCGKIQGSSTNVCAALFDKCLKDENCANFNKCLKEHAPPPATDGGTPDASAPAKGDAGAAPSAAAICADLFPLGEGPYRAVANCTCTQGCATECAEEPKCAAAPKCGFKREAGECTTCVEGSCCAEQAACSGDGECYTCLKSNDDDPKCAKNALRKALAECSDTKCTSACDGRPNPPSTKGDAGGPPVVEHEDDAGTTPTKPPTNPPTPPASADAGSHTSPPPSPPPSSGEPPKDAGTSTSESSSSPKPASASPSGDDLEPQADPVGEQPKTRPSTRKGPSADDGCGVVVTGASSKGSAWLGLALAGAVVLSRRRRSRDRHDA